METFVSALSGEDDGLLQSGEGKREEGRCRSSPTDPVQSINAFTRKTGAFVNKPSIQVLHSLIHDSLFHDISFSVSKLLFRDLVCLLLHICFLCLDDSQSGPALLRFCSSRPGLRGE